MSNVDDLWKQSGGGGGGTGKGKDKKKNTPTTSTTRTNGNGSGTQNVTSGEKPARGLGVPSGYKTPGQGQYHPDKAEFQKGKGPKGRTRYVPGSGLSNDPLYKTGDEAQLGRLSPERIAEVQTALVRMGLLKAGKYMPGRMNPATTTAFLSVLAGANQTGQSWNQYLAQGVADAEAMGYDGGSSSGSERAPLTIALTNPDDIKGDLRKVSSATIGHSLAPGEQDAWVAKTHARETAEQTDAYNQAETGGTIVRAPQTQAAMVEELRKERPDEFVATQIGENARNIMQAFTNGTQAG